MRNVISKLVVMIAMLILAGSLLAACSSIIYMSPDRAKISYTLDGAQWPSKVPAPAFIDKFMYKSKTSDGECVDIYFLSVTKNELNAYVNALRSAGFKLTPVVWQIESESMAKWRADRGDYDYYQAEKGNLCIDVSAKPNGYGDGYIQMRGLTDAETEALEVQSREEEIAGLGGYEAVGGGTTKEYLFDIGSSLDGHIQPEIETDNPLWFSALSAPAFIGRAYTWSGNARQSFIGVGVALSFDEISIQEIVDYLLLLNSKGFKIVQPVFYQFYENVKPHGALDFENYQSFHAWTDHYDGGLLIRADNGQYTLSFSLSRIYIAQDLYEGNDEFLAMYQNTEPIGFELDVTGLNEDEMKSLGFSLYVYNDGRSSYVYSPEEVPGEPEEINHSPYTSEQVRDLATFAHMNSYISIDELGDLLSLFSDGNIDKILEHEEIIKALEHEGVKKALENGDWLYTINMG